MLMPGLPLNANAGGFVAHHDHANGANFPAPTLPPASSARIGVILPLKIHVTR